MSILKFHLGLNWLQYTINYLGVTIPIKPSKDKFELFQLKLDSYCDKLSPKLNLWKTRGLNLFGKIDILKNLILFKICYKLSMLPIKIYPPFINRVNVLTYRFIWVSKWELINRLTLTCSVEMGGAKMLHLPLFVTLNFAQRCNANTCNTFLPTLYFPSTMIHYGNWSYK